MSCGFWNVRGLGVNSDKTESIVDCLQWLNLDILGIAETHLSPSDKIDIKGYNWFNHPRKHKHRYAKSSSGGVGFLIKDEMLKCFHVDILDASHTDILWLKLTSKDNNTLSYLACVCYLPPDGSSSNVDASEFYDVLLTQIYKYQDNGQYFICGDLNSRIGKMKDFIPGEDDVEERDVIDCETNRYGKLLYDFLISSETSILNGRNFISNDFTSVSQKGLAVVDYVIVPQDELKHCTGTEIFRARNLYDIADTYLHVSIPDHSLLKWNMNITAQMHTPNNDSKPMPHMQSKVIYDLGELLGANFMMNADVREKLKQVIQDIENQQAEQSVIDDTFRNFSVIIKEEMNSKLKPKVIKIGSQKKFHKP